MHDISKNRLQQEAHNNLVKELQFDGEKFQQYFRLTRESKTPPNRSGNTWPWRHIIDSPVVFSLQVALRIFTKSESVGRIRIDTQPRDKWYAASGHLVNRRERFQMYELWHTIIHGETCLFQIARGCSNLKIIKNRRRNWMKE